MECCKTLSSLKFDKYQKSKEHTGIDYRYLRKYASQEIDNDHHVNQLLTRKRRSDAIDEAVVERVEAQYDFFSSFIPDKKAVSSKTLESKRILSDPMSKVHEEFKKTNPDIQVSLSHFHKLRPNIVKTAHQMKLPKQCM